MSERCSKAHIIDDKAKNILLSHIPNEWVKNDLPVDYGKDYLIEEYIREGATDKHFYVQLKGKENVKRNRRNGSIALQISTKYLEYYVEKCKFPVFLVVVDTSVEEAYFVHIQQYILDNCLLKEIAGQKTKTIYIPEKNLLKNHAHLSEEVHKAWLYMDAFWKGGVTRVLDSKKQYLEKIDPRFSYEVSIKDGSEHVQINAREKVDMQMHIDASEIDGGLDEVSKKLFEKGLPVIFEPGQLSFTGSKLFEEYFSRFKGPIQFELNNKVAANFRMFALNEDGNVMAFWPECSGTLIAGSKQATFVAKIDEMPIEISLCFDLPGAGNTLNVSINWDFSCWYGKPVKLLPYFDHIYEFISSLSAAALCDLSLEIKGMKLFGASAGKDEMVFQLMELKCFLDGIGNIRKISRYFDINPLLPKEFTDQDFADIDELSALVDSGEYIRPNTYDLNFECDRSEESRVRDSSKPVLYKVTYEKINYDFMGLSFAITGWSETYANAKLDTCTKLDNGRIKVKYTKGTRTIFLDVAET